MADPFLATDKRWCLVTGASAGIGREVALALLRNGFHVAGIARNGARLQELREAWPSHFVPVPFNVSTPGIAHTLIAHGVPVGSLDLVVHAAGCARQGVPLPELNDQDLQDVIASNVLGSTLVVRDMAEVLLRRGFGTLVVLGSVAASDAAPLMAVYSASKAFVNQLVRCVRSDLHGSSVRVTCIQPGTTRTGLLDGQPGMDATERFLGFTPLEAEDLARTILWIYEQPPHVNIQEITVFPVAQSMFVRGVHRRTNKASTTVTV